MLTIEELSRIRTVLDREPNKEELAVFEAMWSEHCSYKSSKRWFHLFKDEASYVELGIGEGAGLINIGDDLLIGLGLESHNHPSAISPYDGAATGVGGIIRDILSQGCRPVAILDSLRFGELESPGLFMNPKKYPQLFIVTGMKDKEGNKIGMFGNGELGWHSNGNSRHLIDKILISLYCVQGDPNTTLSVCNTSDPFYDYRR